MKLPRNTAPIMTKSNPGESEEAGLGAGCPFARPRQASTTEASMTAFGYRAPQERLQAPKRQSSTADSIALAKASATTSRVGIHVRRSAPLG